MFSGRGLESTARKYHQRHCATSGKIAHKSPNGAAVHKLRLERGKAWDGVKRYVYLCPDHRGEWLIGARGERYETSSEHYDTGAA